MNIYLCGVTQNKKDKLQELVKDVHNHFDGLIFVDGGSTDGTVEYLNTIKGKGKIIHRSWSNDFDFQNNEILRQGPLKVGDWFLLRDDEERLNPNFTKNIKSFVEDLDKNGISSCWWLGKGFLYKYYDDMFFQGNPHWGIVNNREKRIDLAKYFGHTDENKEITWNARIGKRSQEDMYKHHLKYYWVYGRSNHLLLGRENNMKEYHRLEINRLNFREYCRVKYNLDYTIESLHNFLLTNEWKNDTLFLEMFNSESILQKYYLSYIENMSSEEIIKRFGVAT